MSSWAFHVSEFILCTIIIRAQVSSCENVEFGMCKYIMAILLTWTPLLYGWGAEQRKYILLFGVTQLHYYVSIELGLKERVLFNECLLHISTSMHNFTVLLYHTPWLFAFKMDD